MGRKAHPDTPTSTLTLKLRLFSARRARDLSKNIKKIKQMSKQIQKNERKAFWTLAVTSQCRIGFLIELQK